MWKADCSNYFRTAIGVAENAARNHRLWCCPMKEVSAYQPLTWVLDGGASRQISYRNEEKICS
jgi:hypothetical protein